jgi:ABC-type polysaccharide/polyol phosphate export permease
MALTFKHNLKQTRTRSALGMLELIFHASVRNVRKTHGNAMLGLLLNILQTILMIVIFLVIFNLMGVAGNKIRGDLVLFLMSGVFMFMTHAKAIGAVAGSEGPTSAIMKHSPMNTIVAISAAALSTLYLQVLSATVVLFFYHAIFTPVTIHQPIGTIGMFLLSWASGVAIGTVFLAMKPWNPEAVGILSRVYARANMIASGKMFVANTMPTSILAFFDWNPLFHTIDQGRGFIFLNYNPRYSDIAYPIYVSLACLMVGLMGEYFTRKKASLSWGAGR